ncbi:hypothetical protein WJX84_008383 [Apatococcus fuscideae]|uniref:AAA+ ATPase domain-containing protein n=1 Tax=Apatococcus fuscideae TaxID=2026836 RepID=A0AAW1TC80_9CHLO
MSPKAFSELQSITQIARSQQPGTVTYKSKDSKGRNTEHTVSIKAYDQIELKKLAGKLATGTIFIGGLYLWKQFTQPLVIQPIMSVVQLYESPLVQIHMLGRAAEGPNARPFKEDNPLAALTACPCHQHGHLHPSGDHGLEHMQGAGRHGSAFSLEKYREGEPWWVWVDGHICLQPLQTPAADPAAPSRHIVPISQPGGTTLAVPAATSISISLDCSRAMEWITLWTSQKAKAAEHQFEDTDSSLDIVEALQAHFQECPRLVSQGQVTSVEPQGATPLAVDPHTTAVHMEGTCSSPLPVGAEFFKDANSSKESSSTCTGGGAILGRSLAAAWHTQPCLPGLPYLLPAWRDIATILAPLVHQGARGRRVRVALLLAGPAGCGRTVAAAAAAAALGLHLIPFSCHDLSSAAGPQAQSKALALALRTAGETAADFSPALLLLRNFEALANSVDGDPGHPGEAGLLQLLDELERLTASPESKKVGSQSIQTALDRHDKGDRRLVLVVACVFALADVPPLLRRIFTHEVEVEAPSLDERAHLLEGMLCQDPTAQSHVPWLQDAAAQTAGLFPRDLRAAAADALAMAAVPGAISIDSGQITIDGLPLPHSAESVHQLPPFLKVTAEHMEKALLGVKRRTATALGAPSVPKVKWEDVGGLEEVKQGVLDTVELPLRHPSLFAAGLKRRSGVLLYGPPDPTLTVSLYMLDTVGQIFVNAVAVG